MQNSDLPATLSPCVRIFLEALCDEAVQVPAPDSRVRPTLNGHSQPQSSAIEPK